MFEFLKRLFSREGAATPRAPERRIERPAPKPAPGKIELATSGPQALTEEDRADISDIVGKLAQGGFDTREEILDAARYYVSDPSTLTTADREWIGATVERAINQKRREEASWPATTEWDRLDGAFEALADQGIVALHNAGYTMADGREEVAEAARDWRRAVRPVGYVFYHGQDVERAIVGDRLMLAYGAFAGAGATTTQIGERVVTTLRRAGFKVEAPKDDDERIAVLGLDWRKRSPV
jgi:hypothetical protein